MEQAQVLGRSKTSECSIGEIAERYGVTLRTLRFYEDKGLLSPRRKGNARFYNAKDCANLECILRCKRWGYSLFEIKNMMSIRKESYLGGETSADSLLMGIDSAKVEQQIRFLEMRQHEISEALHELHAARKRQLAKTH